MTGPKAGGMPNRSNRLVEIRGGGGGGVQRAARAARLRIFVLVGSGRSVFGKAHHQPWL